MDSLRRGGQKYEGKCLPLFASFGKLTCINLQKNCEFRPAYAILDGYHTK